MGSENDMEIPEFPLEFRGKNGILKTMNGEIEITDFEVKIDEDISVSCKSESIPDAYSHEHLSGLRVWDKYIPQEQILDFTLTDENGWKIKISNFYCSIDGNNSLHIVAINFNAKIGNFDNSEIVKLYKILECFNKQEIPSAEDFSPNDLQDLKFIGININDLKYSIGYFLLEDNYNKMRIIEEELIDNLYYLLSFFFNKLNQYENFFNNWNTWQRALYSPNK